MRKATLPLLLLLLPIACAGTPASSTMQNENRHLHGIIRSQEMRIDELTEQRNDLERKVDEFNADAAKTQDTAKVVEKAKSDVSSQVRAMLEKFKSDIDVEVEQTAGGFRFVLREKVLFGTASAELSADGRKALQRVATALRGGTAHVRVEGHTDDLPITKEATAAKYPLGNMQLSTARALAVWQYLADEGKIDAARLSVIGYGAHQPRVPNDSDRNRYRNRRVEIRVEERE
ncbi:MAG: OmpA/MotB family protein [Planctomycetota bacterium]|jgi:chemotaxis protein MotB